MKKRFALFIAVGLAVVALLFGGVAVANQQVKKHLQSKLAQNFSSQENAIGTEVGTSIADRFSGIENTLTAIALDPAVQNDNPNVCNPTLKRYYSSVNIGIGNLGRVNTRGIFYCTINPKLLNKKASSLGTYIQKLFDDPKHNPVVSPEIVVPSAKGYVVALHVPVYDNRHNFKGTIGGAVYLNQLSEQLLSKARFAKTGYVSVQDDNGDIIYSHTSSSIGKNYFSPAIQNQPGLNIKALNQAILAARQGKSQTVSYIGTRDITRIASVQPVTIVPGHRWIILVSVAQSEIATTYFSAGLNYAFSTVLIIAGLALLAALAFVLFTSFASYRLQRTKDQFISLVSHQLRTPLTSIRLYTEMLHDPKVGDLNAKQKEYIEAVHISTVRMIELVGDILNVSRIELNRLKVEPVPTDLAEFLKSEIEEMQPVADEKGVKISTYLSAGINLPVDQTLYGQVVHNLLTNAIRYSPKKTGHVQIGLKRKGSVIELTIADNGIGIPKEARKHIFTRFYRADNAVHAVGDGTGLGL
jgi:signal transduction histidine kinase